MCHREGLSGLGARLSHPLLALLIAAIAAVCAIAQCGLMLDAAAYGVPAIGGPKLALSDTPAGPEENTRVAATPPAVPSPDAARPN